MQKRGYRYFEINEPWLDEITIFGNSNYKIISSVVAEKRPHDAELSPDKKLLVFIFLNEFKRTAEVFKLPGLTVLFKVELLAQKYQYYNTSINFSPDSSYFISNSVSSCISIFEKKEVPFISHDAPSFQSCSFSSCGLKLATCTLRPSLIRLWDVREKCFLAQTHGQYVDKCLFSSCSNFIFGFSQNITQYFAWDSATLKSLPHRSQISPHSCFKCNGNVRVISETFSSLRLIYKPHFSSKPFHLPTGETVVIGHHCSKPFTWKDRKCIILPTSPSTLAVYDYINKEIVDTFRFSFLPPDAFISCLGKLDETDFLIWFGCNQVLLLSLKTSAETSISPFNVNVHNKRITCSTFSPDNLYFVCGYENGILKILSVDCGKTLQTIELKKKPLACYWSKLHLWVTCEKGVIKLCKVSTPTAVLDNVLEQALVEFPVKIRYVFKFEEGVLVFDSFERENNIYISTISDEKEQKFKIFHNTGRYVDSVAISSDGRACLLHRKPSEFELWEMDSKNNWQLVSKGVLEVEESYERFWFCLTGAQNFRVMIMLTSDHIF